MKFITFSILFLPITGLLLAQSGVEQLFSDCGVSGSTTLYHLEDDYWFFSDSSDAQRATLPASTFKILNSAIALEGGAIQDKNEILTWDGTENTFFGARIASWNEDTNMENAFKNSTIWFYEEMASRVGKEKYQAWLESVSYGNGNLSESGDDFWNFGSFGVSPVNQISFLKAFYHKELPFSANTYQSVKRMMVSEESDSYTLFGKTGWTKTITEDIGWWVGYVEKENETWFFATRITQKLTANNPGFSGCRMSITRSALNRFGVPD